MSSRTAQNRYSSPGPGTPPTSSSSGTPSFAQPTRSTAARSRVAAATPRRVVTTPTPRPSVTSSRHGDDSTFSSSASHQAAVEAKTGKKVETLYSHPNVKIIAFSATARTAPRNPNSPTKEVLTWSTHLERTIAVGVFKIYRAPGSVAFLNCGSALQPILPKSQCWCLDEESSRFVLQIRRPNYWRVELPLDSSDDCHRAELLKQVLSEVLLFEQTPCPFERSFIIDIPPQPDFAGSRQPWAQTDPSSYVSPLGPYDQTPNPDSHISTRSSRSGSVTSNNGHFPLYDRRPSGGYERPGTSHSESSYSEVSEADSDYTDSSYLATPRQDNTNTVEENMSAESRRQEWIRKQYVHSLSNNDSHIRSNNSGFTDEYSDFDDDVSEVGSVVSDLTHVRTMTSRSLYSRQRETTIFEAEDVAPRPSATPSRSLRRTGNEIHEGSGMGGNSVMKRRLRRPGFATPRAPSQVDLAGARTAASRSSSVSRPQSPLSMGYITPVPLTMAPRPAGLKSHSARARASTTSSRSSTSTIAPPREEEKERKAELKKPEVKKTEVKKPEVKKSESKRPEPKKPELKKPEVKKPEVKKEVKKEEPKKEVKVEEAKKDVPKKSEIPKPVPKKETPKKELSKETPKKDIPKPVLADLPAPTLAPVPQPATVTPAPEPTKKQLTLDTAPIIIPATKPQMTILTNIPPPETPINEAHAISPPHPPSAPALRQRPRHRMTASISHRGAFTPTLPTAAQLLSPPRMRQFGRTTVGLGLNPDKTIPWSIVAKTCDLILGPPGSLVKLMLRVAAKIVAGEWRGTVYGRGVDGSEIPVAWDWSEGEYEEDLDENGDGYYERGRRLASGRLTPDIEDLD